MERIHSLRKRSRANTDIGKFFNLAEDVRKLIQDLVKLVNDVKEIETDILAVPIPNDTRHQELNDLYSKVKADSKIIQTKLKVIEKGIRASDDKSIRETVVDIENHGVQRTNRTKGSKPKYTPVAIRIRQTQHSALLKQFTDVIKNYQLAQVNYRDQVKARLIRQLEITNSAYSEEDLEDMLDRGNVTVFTKSIITHTEVAKQNLEDIQARHQGLVKLEKSIRELAELFQELAQTVELQGAVIDNIELNVLKTEEYFQQGGTELEKALPMQMSGRKKKVCLVMTGVIILSIIVIIVIIEVVPKLTRGK